MIGHMRHGAPPRLMAPQSIGSTDLQESHPTPSPRKPYYSELGHFYVPWMARLGLIGTAHLAGFPVGQLGYVKGSATAVDAFARSLACRWCEIVRVCKPDARLV